MLSRRLFKNNKRCDVSGLGEWGRMRSTGCHSSFCLKALRASHSSCATDSPVEFSVQCSDTFGRREGHLTCKTLGVGLLAVMI